ncbi:MAG: GNAT family N-acetyltransferase [Pseudomonadota bacterium]
MSVVTYRPLDPCDAQDLAVCQAVFREAPSFVYPTGGRPATDADVVEMFTRLPKSVSPADMHVCAIDKDGTTCGFHALLRGYPDSRTAYIALLLLIEKEQSRLLGAQALRHIESEAKSWGCTTLAGVVDSLNDRALRFWLKQGFIEEFRKPASGFMGDAIGIHKHIPN